MSGRGLPCCSSEPDPRLPPVPLSWALTPAFPAAELKSGRKVALSGPGGLLELVFLALALSWRQHRATSGLDAEDLEMALSEPSRPATFFYLQGPGEGKGRLISGLAPDVCDQLQRTRLGKWQRAESTGE